MFDLQACTTSCLMRYSDCQCTQCIIQRCKMLTQEFMNFIFVQLWVPMTFCKVIIPWLGRLHGRRNGYKIYWLYGGYLVGTMWEKQAGFFKLSPSSKSCGRTLPTKGFPTQLKARVLWQSTVFTISFLQSPGTGDGAADGAWVRSQSKVFFCMSFLIGFFHFYECCWSHLHVLLPHHF